MNISDVANQAKHYWFLYMLQTYLHSNQPNIILLSYNNIIFKVLIIMASMMQILLKPIQNIIHYITIINRRQYFISLDICPSV